MATNPDPAQKKGSVLHTQASTSCVTTRYVADVSALRNARWADTLGRWVFVVDVTKRVVSVTKGVDLPHS